MGGSTQRGSPTPPDRGWIPSLERVKEGYARKLAHLWRGPFRVVEQINDFTIKLEITGSGYHLFPIVHVSNLKLVKAFPDRPKIMLNVEGGDRLDLDEALLPENSWIRDLVLMNTKWRKSPI